MSKLFVIVALALALAGCGSSVANGSASQTATVTMGDTTCAVQPVNQHPGPLVFTVRNATSKTLAFAVSEDNDTTMVGSVHVAPNAVGSLSITIDHGDVYTLKCGTVLGPPLAP